VERAAFPDGGEARPSLIAGNTLVMKTAEQAPLAVCARSRSCRTCCRPASPMSSRASGPKRGGRSQNIRACARSRSPVGHVGKEILRYAPPSFVR
jgi:hypothetical protein